jgi:hypothetical protein
MTRKQALSAETLTALGADKLAQLILDEAAANAAFRKRVIAALASTKGADAVAKLIDRRLAALERARAAVGWEKERAFADDLGATVDTIAKELAPLDPFQAVDRLLRFIDTHVSVFDRIDDSGGRIQGVYHRACEAVPDLVRRLSPDDLAWLPGRLLASLRRDTHGLTTGIAVDVAALLPPELLATWDQALKQAPGDVSRVRQAIADARGDVDGFLALEAALPEWRQDPLKAAERLLSAGRAKEALTWVRREKKGGLGFATLSDIADGRINRVHDRLRVQLEARILEALKQKPAAQALRWASFAETLDAGTLRDYIAGLDDFIEREELDRAFAVAAASPHLYSALAFFRAWPRLYQASRLVMARRAEWDGRNYEILSDAATALEGEFPLAATVLYRALLGDILGRARSPAYGHGARHLARLAALSAQVDWRNAGLDDHQHYVADIKKAHGRKIGFWSLVAGPVSLGKS